MNLTRTWQTLTVGETTTRAYSTRPAVGVGPRPGVVVVQEVWGVDGHVRDVCDRLADAGYAVLAPDLFGIGGTPETMTDARLEDAKAFLDTVPQAAWFDASLRQPALDALPEPRRSWMTATLGVLLNRDRPFERYAAAVAAAVQALASEGVKVGVTGFCMGGGFALRAAAQVPQVSACAPFYGPVFSAELLKAITCPVQGHFAELDPGINANLPALKEGLGAKLELHQYTGAKHAFMNDTRGNFHPASARLAWARLLGFFAQHL